MRSCSLTASSNPVDISHEYSIHPLLLALTLALFSGGAFAKDTSSAEFIISVPPSPNAPVSRATVIAVEEPCPDKGQRTRCRRTRRTPWSRGCAGRRWTRAREILAAR
jgi:hypothetical protein